MLVGLRLSGVCALALLLHAPAVRADDRPVIGVLTQPSDSSLTKYGSEYLVASYVKWMEGSGARVAPLRWNATDAEVATLFGQISGILIPGGHCGFHTTEYGVRVNKMLDLARHMNQIGVFFPVWGTCQGMQQLAQYGDGHLLPSVISATDTEDLALALTLTPTARQSRLLRDAPADVMATLTNLNVTLNLHHYSVRSFNLSKRHPRVVDFYEMIATGVGREGLEFITLMEGKELPFYGSQFHPEKNAYEWDQSWEASPDVNGTVVQSRAGVRAVSYLADFFISEARKCPHSWPPTGSTFPLIYATPPLYVAHSSSDLWEQIYAFGPTRQH